MTRLFKLLNAAMLVLTLSAPALAEGGRVPKPVIPQAKGDQCVEDTAVMRRQHMDYLMAHRDRTMHEGVRSTKYSLKECLECHAAEEQPLAAGQSEEQHFCKSCHQYAGVKIDCFGCHATKPEKNPTFHPLVTPGMSHGNHQPASAVLEQLAAEAAQTGVNE